MMFVIKEGLSSMLLLYRFIFLYREIKRSEIFQAVKCPQKRKGGFYGRK